MKRNILFFITLLYLTACGGNTNQDPKLDDFYSDKGGFDYGRIPLIKPYELTTSSRENYWTAETIDTSEVPLNMPGARNINIVNSIIFIYGRETILNGQEVDAAWFVIIPKNHIVRGFMDHKKYLAYIQSIGFQKEPLLYDVQEVYRFFSKHNKVDWKEISLSLKAEN